MTSTSTRTGRAVSGTASGVAPSAGSQALRAAGRQLVATAGNQVLKVAVDRAIGGVDHMAGRLDAVASGERSARTRAPAKRKPSQRSAEQRERDSANPVRVKMGAAFSLIMQQALRLLHLIRRLAEQLLAVASRLFRRGDDAASSTSDVTESRRVDRMVPRDRTGKVNKAERTDAKRRADRPRPSAGQPARTPPASRRHGPRPAAREAAGAPRRSAGDRPVRAARND